MVLWLVSGVIITPQNGATEYNETGGKIFLGGLIDTQGDTADLSIQIAVNDQTYNFSTTITSSNPFPTAAIDFSANKILLFFPNQIGDDKYSFTAHLMNFDPDTSSVTILMLLEQ